MNTLNKIWETLKGHKTYIVAVAAVIYGAYVKDANIILIGLGLAGIRHSVSTEVAKILVSPDPVQTAKQDAPQVAAEAVQAVVDATTPVQPVVTTPAEVPAEAPVQQ